MIIIRNDSSTLAIAMPSVLRVMVSAHCEIGSARLNEKITSPMPISMVSGMLISVSTSHLMLRRTISRCNNHGSTITFSTSVINAE